MVGVVLGGVIACLILGYVDFKATVVNVIILRVKCRWLLYSVHIGLVLTLQDNRHVERSFFKS